MVPDSMEVVPREFEMETEVGAAKSTDNIFI